MKSDNQPIAPLEVSAGARSVSADLLKALSIFAVVFIHSGNLIPFTASEFDFQNPEQLLHISSRLLRFCVPVFLFLWAYFLEKSIIKRGTKTLFPRFLRLFIPFIFWSTVYFVYTADFITLTLSGAVTKHWLGYGWAGQYYFIILFQLMALFPAIRRISLPLCNSSLLIIIISVLMFFITSYSGLFDIGLMKKVGERLFIFWLPYILLGIIYVYKDIFSSQMLYIIITGIILAISAEIFYYPPSNERPYLTPLVFLITLLTLRILKLEVGDILGSRQIIFISYIANNTLGIFCLNPLLVITLYPLIKRLDFQLQFPGATVIVPLVSAAIVTALCLIIIEILKRIRLGMLVAN